MVVAIEMDKQAPGGGWGFAEFARRNGDYALACVAAVVNEENGRAQGMRIAAMGIADTALRLSRAEAALEGSDFSEAAVAAAVATVREDVDPMTDLAASADYRRHLVGELAQDVLRDAWTRACAGSPR